MHEDISSPVRFASVFQKVYLSWNLWQAASSALYENTIFRRHKNRQRKSTPGLIVGHRKASDSDGRRQSVYETRRKFFPCRRVTGTGDRGLRCHGAAVWTRKKKNLYDNGERQRNPRYEFSTCRFLSGPWILGHAFSRIRRPDTRGRKGAV